MRKFIATCVVFILALSFTACGKGTSAPAETDESPISPDITTPESPSDAKPSELQQTQQSSDNDTALLSPEYTEELYQSTYDGAINHLEMKETARVRKESIDGMILSQATKASARANYKINLIQFLVNQDEFNSYTRNDPFGFMNDAIDTQIYYYSLMGIFKLAEQGNPKDIELAALFKDAVAPIEERMQIYINWTEDMRNNPQNDDDIIALATIDAFTTMAWEGI